MNFPRRCRRVRCLVSMIFVSAASAVLFAASASVRAEGLSGEAVGEATPAVIPVSDHHAAGTGAAVADAYAFGSGGPGYWQPGGYEGRIGSPYYYSPQGNGRQYWYGAASGTPAHAAYVPGGGGWDRPHGSHASGHGFDSHGYGSAYGTGYGAGGDPYTAHFGPGFHRHTNYGHYRFPYYNYRAPWYFPGPAVWNRDTNFAW